MNERAINITSITGTTVIGLILMFWFLASNPAADFVEFIPGLDNKPANMSIENEEVNIGAIYAAFDGIPSGISVS